MGAAFPFSVSFNNEEGCAGFIPYSSHVTKDIVKLKSGDYVAVLKLQGAAHESADPDDINAWHFQLNDFLRQIASPKVAVWSHIVRREYNEFPEGEFPAGFLRDLNEKYKEFMGKEKMLINELYISIIYRPQPAKAIKMFEFLNSKKEEDLIQEQMDEIEQVEDYISKALIYLDRYQPELLTCYEHNERIFSEVLEFFAFLVNGEYRRFPLVNTEIADVLTTSRPFFGKGGLMSLKRLSDVVYMSPINFKTYGPVTKPTQFDQLLGVPFEFVLSQSFTFLSNPVAKGRMTRQRGRMVNAGDVATSQIQDIGEALDDLTSGLFFMGAHSLSLIVKSNDAKTLNENVSLASRVLSDSGCTLNREDSGIAAAFYEQLPGNFEYRLRVSDISSLNFAAKNALHNYPIGRITNNQWGPAVTMFKTTSGAPFYFNFHKTLGAADKLHLKADKDHKDLANTIIIGQSGSGKTALQMFLLAQLQKFNRPDLLKRLSCIFFDKDLGASVGIRAMGGKYLPIKNGMPTGFNPFHLDDTPNNVTFLEQLIMGLVYRAETPLTPTQEKNIHRAVRGVMDARWENRRISSLLEFFDPTEENGIYQRLEKWCGHGSLAWVFDNPEDTLVLDDEHPIIGFDVTEFIDNPVTRGPTISYLFHRVEKLIDGRRIPIFLDEFWKLAQDPAFATLICNKLVTIRKQDGFLVMGTQYPEQLTGNKQLVEAVVGQTATQIFLPNPKAKQEGYIGVFGLTQTEYELVKTFPESSRRFLIKQGQNSVIAEFNLKGFGDELAVLSGNTATALLTEKLIAEYGENPNDWLPVFHRIRKESL